MSQIASVKWVNEAEFVGWLTRLDATVRRENLRAILTSGAFKAEELIKLKITDIHLIDTGNLRASIHLVKIFSTNDTRAEAWVGTNVVYARIHEYGGVIKAKHGYLVFQTKDGAWHKVPAVTIPARPYMRPAIHEGEGDILGAMNNEYGRRLKAA